MSQDNNDVDIDKLLADDSQSDDTAGASSGNQAADDNGDKKQNQDSNQSGKNSDLSKRETGRLAQFANDIAEIKAALAGRKQPVESNSEADRSYAQPTDLESFLEQSVPDEASRKVLRQYAAFLGKDIDSRYGAKFSEVDSFKAAQQFSELKVRIPALAAYESEVMKTLQNNPGKSIKAVIGEILVERALTKIKPTETQGSQASREPVVTDDMSLDDMYDLIGAK